MLRGRDGLHTWTSPDAITLRINELDDISTGAPKWPRYRILDVDHGYPEAGATQHKRIGQAGAVAHPDYRGSRIHTYTIEVMGRTIDELRQAEETLRQAFYDQSAEGRMDVGTHPLNPDYDADEDRYFNAKAGSLQPGTDAPDSDLSPELGFRREWVIDMRNHEGVYYEELTIAGFKRAIIDLGPSLYWALDSADGTDDLSGNGRDGTAVGSPTIGGSTALLPGISGDDSTDLDGSSQRITSSYDPFGADPITVIGWVKRDATASDDVLFGGTDASHCPAVLAAASPGTGITSFIDLGDVGTIDSLGTWVGTSAGMFAVVMDPGDTISLYADGALGDGSPDAIGAFHASTGDFQIGAYGSGTAWLDGKIAHVAVFERALSAATIAQIHAWASGAPREYV